MKTIKIAATYEIPDLGTAYVIDPATKYYDENALADDAAYVPPEQRLELGEQVTLQFEDGPGFSGIVTGIEKRGAQQIALMIDSYLIEHHG